MLRSLELLVIASFLLPPPALSPSGLQKVIEQDIWVPAPPLGHCVVPELAGHVFKATSTPGGSEYLPGGCAGDPVAKGERVTLQGLAAREALDRLVQIDPRYRWVEKGGVLIVRPVEAWNDPNHFLHRRVSVAFTNQNVGGALNAVLTAIGPIRFAGEQTRTFNTLEMNQQFSVSLDRASVLEVLNAVARTHGHLQWAIGYCQPQRSVEFARILLHTFDGGGTGGEPVGTLTDPNGRLYHPCFDGRQ